MNLSVVTMGSSVSRSTRCVSGYDDAFTVSLAWNAISHAFLPPKRGSGSSPRDGRRRNRDDALKGGSDNRHDTDVDVNTNAAKNRSARHKGPSPPTRDLRSAGNGSTTSGALASPPSAPTAERKRTNREFQLETEGSCTCDCPYSLGFGRCFDVLSSDIPPGVDPEMSCSKLPRNSSVFAKISNPARWCPLLGISSACDPTKPTNVSEVCKYGGMCDLLSECGSVAGFPPDFAVATCQCPFFAWEHMECEWSPQPCVYSPYYPPG